ncbi:30S ribosomal protein S19 [Candidatus Roizmanbacteria bacterium]|nr:30S ribosomal protein S19 [Candidatus Roizmanbacteria bacterium]
MTRSAKKGPYIDIKLLAKVEKQKAGSDRTPIKTWARRSQIPPEFVGHKFGVYNGKRFIEVLVSETMIGHRLGEFSPTRTFHGHGKITKRTADKT